MLGKVVKYSLDGVFVIASGIVILHYFFPIGTYNETFVQISDLSARLSLSFIAAYIFYWLNIRIPRKQLENHLNPFLMQNVKRIIGDGESVFRRLSDASSIPLTFGSVLKHTLQDICSKVNPNAEAPIVNHNMMPQNNVYFMSDRMHRSKGAIASCERITPWLDAELLQVLFEIDNCAYFKQIAIVTNQRLENQDICFLADSLIEYQQLLSKLQKYKERRLMKYG